MKFEVISAESLLAHVQVCSTLVDSIEASQGEDPHLGKDLEEVQVGKVSKFVIDTEGVFMSS